MFFIHWSFKRGIKNHEFVVRPLRGALQIARRRTLRRLVINDLMFSGALLKFHKLCLAPSSKNSSRIRFCEFEWRRQRSFGIIQRRAGYRRNCVGVARARSQSAGIQRHWDQNRNQWLHSTFTGQSISQCFSTSLYLGYCTHLSQTNFTKRYNQNRIKQILHYSEYSQAMIY